MQRVKASSAQLKCLIDFMKVNKECAAGGRTNGLEGKMHLEKQWQRLVETLNGLGGPVKSVGKWKQTWRDIRSNGRKKALRNRKEFKWDDPGGTENGSSQHKTPDETISSKSIDIPLLTPAEQKCKEQFLAAESSETVFNTDIEGKPKIIFQKLIKAKLNIAVLKRQLIIEELQERKLRKQILKEEMQHKREISELEKQETLLRIEILKTELENKRKINTS